MIAPTEDVDRIMGVMSAAFDPTFGEAWNRRQVEDALLVGNCHYFLACAPGTTAKKGDTVAGFSLSRSGVDEEELLLLAVDPAYRRMGIAKYILAELLIAARTRGATRLVLEMRRDNPAEALYRTNGFRPIGIRPAYYCRSDGQSIDAITFECPID